MSKKAYFSSCPRCGSHAFEQMSNYAHCTDCLYSEDYYEDLETNYRRIASLEEKLVQTENTENENEAVAS